MKSKLLKVKPKVKKRGGNGKPGEEVGRLKVPMKITQIKLTKETTENQNTANVQKVFWTQTIIMQNPNSPSTARQMKSLDLT